jgi:hypothetical protein
MGCQVVSRVSKSSKLVNRHGAALTLLLALPISLLAQDPVYKSAPNDKNTDILFLL